MTWNAEATGSVVLVCEHASAMIPERYGSLGLSASVATSHAAWDPGALALARQLSASLNAPLVASGISRLVHDCNRPPGQASAMPLMTEAFEIPGNAALTPQEIEERVATVYRPFEAALERLLDARLQASLPTVLVTIHSFTPHWFGKVRTVELGLLNDTDTRLTDAMLELAGKHVTLNTQPNEPYSSADGVTWTLQRHALPRAIANVMIEVRNDLLNDAAAVERVAEQLAALLLNSVQSVLPDQQPVGAS